MPMKLRSRTIRTENDSEEEENLLESEDIDKSSDEFVLIEKDEIDSIPTQKPSTVKGDMVSN